MRGPDAGRYRRISVRMWGDEKFNALSPLRLSGQALWIYLITGPHCTSLPGLWRWHRQEIESRFGASKRHVSRCRDEIRSKGLLLNCDAHDIILIVNVKKFDPPASPNVLIYWGRLFDEIPACELKIKFYEELMGFIFGHFSEAFHAAFVKAFRKPYAKPCLNASPNPDPDPDPKRTDLISGDRSPQGGHSVIKPPEHKSPAMERPEVGITSMADVAKAAADPAVRALMAWNLVTQVITEPDPQRRIIEDRSVLALARIGGWEAFERASPEDLAALRRGFIQAYHELLLNLKPGASSVP